MPSVHWAAWGTAFFWPARPLRTGGRTFLGVGLARTDSTRTVSAPVGSMYRYAAGAQYHWNEHLTTGFSYEFLWEGSLPLEQFRRTGTTLSGQFTNTLVSFYSRQS